MAYISKQCVECTHPTKRECGKYYGTDEKGKYSGTLYECNNVCCKIYYSRVKPKTPLPITEEPTQVSERSRPKHSSYQSRTGKYNNR